MPQTRKSIVISDTILKQVGYMIDGVTVRSFNHFVTLAIVEKIERDGARKRQGNLPGTNAQNR